MEWITKKKFYKGFDNSLFFWREEKGERITNCRTFNDPIDFHPKSDMKID